MQQKRQNLNLALKKKKRAMTKKIEKIGKEDHFRQEKQTVVYVVSFRLAGGHLWFSKILKDKRKGKLGFTFQRLSLWHFLIIILVLILQMQSCLHFYLNLSLSFNPSPQSDLYIKNIIQKLLPSLICVPCRPRSSTVRMGHSISLSPTF